MIRLPRTNCDGGGGPDAGDGRFRAGYHDVDGTRKFITCRTEEEVLARFQVLQPVNWFGKPMNALISIMILEV